MNRLLPCKRREFIRKVRQLGFEGPRPGTRHDFIIFGGYRLSIPSSDEYSVRQMAQMLREIEEAMGRTVTRDEWDRL